MLYLARHGQTEANASGRLLGRLDPPLTDVGRAQAAALAPVLRDAARVVSSPLLRARQTAEAIRQAGDGGTPVEVDDRWIELDYGIWDGRPLAEVPSELWSRWRDDPEFVPEGGESLAALGRRVADACQALADEAATDDVVVVSHVSPIKAAVAWALGVGDGVAWRMFVDVASLTRIAITDRGPVLRSFNEVHHLSAPAP
jgi:broad specificity phosphatase PhoE